MKGRMAAFAALLLTALLCMGGVASAKSVKAKAPIQGGNKFCGKNETGDPVWGTVTFKRVGNSVTVKVKMNGGPPSTFFEVALYGNGCQSLGALASFTTSATGTGKAKATWTVPEGDTEFFADLFEPGPFLANDTPYVSLP
jgi:hypothetical protein